MTSNTIKFIAADMDGTMLNDEGKLDPAFFELFEELEKHNIMFAAASGRQYASLADTFAPIKDRMLFIAENGTMVKRSNEEIYSCTMDNRDIAEIIKTARTIPGAVPVLSGKKTSYTDTSDTKYIEEIGKYYHSVEFVDDLLQVEDEFIKISICHFGGSEELVYPIMNEKFSANNQVVVSAKVWMDIFNLNGSKGDAIKHLQQSLGFSYQESMCFGDYFNDIEMLKASYHSYAMQNAHPEVKKHARFSAPSNNERGVSQVLREYLSQLKRSA